MNKKLVLILFVLLIIIVLIPKSEKELRIRVIANSNSSYDQDIKMEVVKTLKYEINKLNQNNIINEVKRNINLLDRKISIVLKNREYSIEIDKVQFPTKEINGQIIPGGYYETLLIVIEEGKGKNWWSILNPSFHKISFEDIETGEVEFKFYFFEKLKKLLS